MTATKILSFLFTILCIVCGDIILNTYDNSIFSGTPTNVTLTSLDYTWSYNSPSSAQIHGTISWPTNTNRYYFHCIWDSNIFGFVFIDDHQICYENVYKSPAIDHWDLNWTSTAYKTRKSMLRVEIYTNPSVTHGSSRFRMQWSLNNNNAMQTISNQYLSRTVPALQQQRLSFQKGLISNAWSTWFWTNLLAVVRMPDSFGITFGVCTSSTGTSCQTTQVVSNGLLRVGAHAIDHSYFEYNLSWSGMNIGYQYAQKFVNSSYSHLYVAMRKISGSGSPYAYITQRMYWQRSGQLSANINRKVNNLNCLSSLHGSGLPQSWYLCTNAATVTAHNSGSLISFGSNNNIIYFTTDTSITSWSQVATYISQQEQKEYATYNKYGSLSDTKFAVQSAVIWNFIYTPAQYGPITPICRGSWAQASTGDFQYVYFDWDTIFATYLLSFDMPDYALSTFIELIKDKTVNGFIASYKWDRAGYLAYSEDRSQPITAANVLYRMYKKYGSSRIRWVVELLFDDILDWNNWYWIRRRCTPLNLVCWGSDPNLPVEQNQENYMQAARYESGLDNSPMYDTPPVNFDTRSHHMLLYDVGASGIYAKDTKDLIALANVIGRSDAVATLQPRYDFMIDAINQHLWDSSMGIFLNRLSDSGQVYAKITPTLFYPLMTGDFSVSQAESMVSKYLMSNNYFCISANWPSGQPSDCYYGLPSIAHNDATFKQQAYWRGLTWAPMAQFVWWSLEPYANRSTIVRNGQRALEKQMNAMMLNVWNARRHICENYSPASGRTDCTGIPFYHWGGLSGYLSLLNEYYYT